MLYWFQVYSITFICTSNKKICITLFIAMFAFSQHLDLKPLCLQDVPVLVLVQCNKLFR